MGMLEAKPVPADSGPEVHRAGPAVCTCEHRRFECGHGTGGAARAGDTLARMKTLSIPTPIHGRVLVHEAADPVAVVVGFHGYTENAAIQMERLTQLPGSERWTLVSVQGLHRFYRGRTAEVIASWMTRQDRDEMIADNIEYADRAIEAAAPAGAPLFTVGFSQGAAMAFRAGVRGRREAAGVIAVGGDVPPELLADPSARFPAALLARGERDEWYTAGKLAADLTALATRGVTPDVLEYPGAHEWTPDVAAAISRFVDRVSERA
jgi:predicted esterase